MDFPIIKDQIWPELNQLVEAEQYHKIAVLVDSNTLIHCLPTFADEFECEFEIIEIEPGETSKDLVICSHIWLQLSESLFERNSLLINLGGGVVTDLGGFIAGIYKRGIDFINLPTSLLGMVDASVGHKCGIDFMHLKNQLGLFNSPKAVFIRPSWLETLDLDNLKSAFAEMLKHGLISSPEHFQNLINLDDQLAGVERFIQESIAIKFQIVTEDLNEKGIRKTLNFGHTIGHALESVLISKGETILHGFAVACGIHIESQIAQKLNLLTSETFTLIENNLFKYFAPIAIEASDLPKITALLKHDKKSKNGQIKMALIDSIGSCRSSVDVEESLIVEVLKKYVDDYST